MARERLLELGLDQYFVCSRISLEMDKPSQVSSIAQELNLQLQHVALIDDDPSERAFVSYALPDVTLIEADRVPDLLEMPAFRVESLTPEAAHRRALYQAERLRKEMKERWEGDTEGFLASCKIDLVLRRATADDMPRVGELIERTNRLNSNSSGFRGRDLGRLLDSPRYRVTVAQMSDRFGSYGTVGVVLTLDAGAHWSVELLLVSCRALGRGVGETLLCHEIARARAAKASELRAVFQPTPYNRAMNLLFIVHGFQRRKSDDGAVLVHDLEEDIPYRPWLSVHEVA
jgi:FkbH-like protein